MAMYGEITYRQERRLCRVDDEYGYFHCWEHYATPVEPSPMVGGSPGGQFSRVYGIIEFEKEVKRIEPGKIKFCDDDHATLRVMNETIQWEEGEDGQT